MKLAWRSRRVQQIKKAVREKKKGGNEIEENENEGISASSNVVYLLGTHTLMKWGMIEKGIVAQRDQQAKWGEDVW